MMKKKSGKRFLSWLLAGRNDNCVDAGECVCEG